MYALYCGTRANYLTNVIHGWETRALRLVAGFEAEWKGDWTVGLGCDGMTVVDNIHQSKS
jgi:hypothetical protein